jgi:hypothetical protein
MISWVETLLVVIGLSVVFLKLPKISFKYNLISPLTLTSVFIVLYMIIGFELFWQGSYFFLGINFSDDLDKVYKVTTVFVSIFFILFSIFFRLYRKRRFYYDYQCTRAPVYSLVFVVACYSVMAINGFKIPVLHNFILLFFNAAIVVVSYSFITGMRGSSFLLFLFTILISYIGFRYRLIYLFLPILFSFFIFKKINFTKFAKYSLLIFLGILAVSIVGITRSYSSGLQLGNLSGMEVGQIIVKGVFNDTSTMLTSGALIDWLETTENFAYFEQISYVLNYFIPSALYPDKNYSPIFSYISTITGQESNEAGAAVLGFAEYYHTAGYYGVVLFALIYSLWLAFYFKKIINSSSKFEHFTYFILVTWLLNSFTRGYLPQNIQDLVSIIIGLYFIRRMSIGYKYQVM